MLQAIRRRLEKDEEGFTLIELMVVVLIIAILLAIAIPTFLGARGRAQDASAKSNLRNALTADKTYYTDNQTYTSSTVLLGAIEPALSFTDQGTTAATLVAAANPQNVFISTNAGFDTVTLGTVSKSGKCFWIKDAGVTATQYADGACTVPATWFATFP